MSFYYFKSLFYKIEIIRKKIANNNNNNPTDILNRFPLLILSQKGSPKRMLFMSPFCIKWLIFFQIFCGINNKDSEEIKSTDPTINNPIFVSFIKLFYHPNNNYY